jgi:septal ring factor EnvC (AmiA/AmiB activator)
MDEQCLEEIAERYAAPIDRSVPRHMLRKGRETERRDRVADYLKQAIREALSSQEEELRSLREERDTLLRQRKAVDAAMLVHQQTVKRAESAEAELQRLLEGIEPFRHFVERERALRNAQGKGGQSVGDSPSINPSVLKELERMLALVAAPVEVKS